MTNEEWKRLMLMTPEERKRYMDTRNNIQGAGCCLVVLLVLIVAIGVSCESCIESITGKDKKQTPPEQSTPAPQQQQQPQQPQGYSWPETSGPRQ